MKVNVHLLGDLARYSPEGKEKFQLEFSGEAIVAHLWEKICFPEDLEVMILVNGRQAKPTTPLAEGDEVFIFSPAAGG